MDYKQALENLRQQVFSTPEVVEPPKRNSFIPARGQEVAPPKDSNDLVSFSRSWLQEIKTSSEAAKQGAKSAGGNFGTGFVNAIVDGKKAKAEREMTAARTEGKEAFIKRRGDTPSTYSPESPQAGADTSYSPTVFAGDWGAVAQAVKDIESGGGNYSIRGPVVKTGMYKGERAMGAYQVMPGNLPQWSKAALGREVSQEEFLASPEIQDAIFIHQMKNAKDKYGSVDDAVSVWFSGRPLAKAGNASDGYMTTPAYVAKFQKQYASYKKSVK